MKYLLSIILLGATLSLRAADSTDTSPAAVALTNSTPAAPAVTNTIAPNSFEAFKIVAERNIFDPNRRQRSRGGPPPAETVKPKPIEAFTLVGAMSYSKGAFAFFEGTSSDYRKSVKPGDSIAGYKVSSVTTTNVTLEAGDKKVDLPVGSQMKRRGDEEWQFNATAEDFASSENSDSRRSDRGDRGGDRRDRYESRRRGSDSDSSSSSTSSTPTSRSDSSSGASSGGESDALKRLLERRQKEQ